MWYVWNYCQDSKPLIDEVTCCHFHSRPVQWCDPGDRPLHRGITVSVWVLADLLLCLDVSPNQKQKHVKHFYLGRKTIQPFVRNDGLFQGSNPPTFFCMNLHFWGWGISFHLILSSQVFNFSSKSPRAHTVEQPNEQPNLLILDGVFGLKRRHCEKEVYPRELLVGLSRVTHWFSFKGQSWSFVVKQLTLGSLPFLCRTLSLGIALSWKRNRADGGNCSPRYCSLSSAGGRQVKPSQYYVILLLPLDSMPLLCRAQNERSFEVRTKR